MTDTNSLKILAKLEYHSNGAFITKGSPSILVYLCANTVRVLSMEFGISYQVLFLKIIEAIKDIENHGKIES